MSWSSWGWMMAVFVLLFLMLPIAGIILVVRSSGTDHSRQRRVERRAPEILDKRFAGGEIDREEYDERRRVQERSA